MKRITKIAIILLAMALIVGSMFAIFASAADDTAGITKIHSANFESAEVKDYLADGVYSGSQYPTIGGQQFQLNKVGTLSVKSGVNVDGSSNKYAFYTPNVASDLSSYSVYSMKNNISTHNSVALMSAQLTADANNLSYKMDGHAFVFDVDIASTENYATFPYYARIQLLHTYLYDNAGTATYTTKTPELVLSPKYAGSSEAKLAVSGGGAYCYIDASKWNHLTVASYVEKNESSYDIYVTVWVNGEFAFTHKAISDLQYYVPAGTDTKHVASSILHSRFLVIGEKRVEPYAGIAMDNTSYRYIDRSANISFEEMIKEGSDMTEWAGNLYNPSTMPKTLPTVQHNDTETGFYYANSTGAWTHTTSLSTALTGAKTHSTIHMVGDNTVTFAKDEKIKLDNKNLAIDLGGNVLTCLPNNQSGFYLSNNTTFTIKNGELRATQAPESTYANKTFALFHGGSGTITLNLENVDTYVGQLANSMNWNSKHCFNVNINGGYHSAETTGYCHVTGGLFDSRIQMNLNATDATFFFNSKSWLVSQRYRWKDNAPMESTFNFTRCTIIDDPTNTSTWGAIRYANEYAFFTFNDCDIYSEINPQGHSSEDWVYDASIGNYSTTEKYNPIPASNIIFGEGTRFYSGVELKYTYPSANAIITGSESESYTINGVCDTPASGFTFTEKTFTLTYDRVIGKGAEYAFQYVSGGVTYHTDDFVTALTGADDGTTVTLLRNLEYTAETDNDTSLNETFEIARISKSITLDLNDKTLTIYQPEQNPINITKALTVKDGTLRAVVTANNWTKNMTHPLFQFGANSATLNLENVTTYLSGLAYSYQCTDWTVNITGGSHYITNGAQGANAGGWISSRASATVNVSNATFYISGSGVLAGATSDKLTASMANVNNTFNFDSCTIVSTSDTSMIEYANENTYLNFTGNCVIDAPINPAVYSSDKNGKTSESIGAIKEGSISFGAGTRYNSTKTMIGGGVIVYEDGYELVENATIVNKTYYPTTATPYTDNFKITETAYALFTDISVSDSSILDSYEIKYTLKKKNAYSNDILEALTNADANSTLTFLKDYTLESPAEKLRDTDEIAYSFYKDLTIDLNEKTLTVWQHIQYAFRIYRNVTFKNGNVNVARDNNAPYPIFYIASGGYTLTLDNVNTYGAYIYGIANNATIKVEGGTHVATQSIGGTTGRGWLTATCSTNLIANNATFFNDNSIGIISSISRNQASTVADSTFTFNNCTFIEDPNSKGNVSGTFGSSQVMGQGIIWYANENSFFNFNDCDIHASVNPQRYWDSATYCDYVGGTTSSDTTLWGPISKGAIVFGVGTKYDTSYTIVNDGTIVTTAGYSFGSISESKTMTITDGSDTPISGGALDFKFADRELTLNLKMAVIYPDGYKVKYTVGGVVAYGDDFVEALTNADANSTIYLQANYILETVGDYVHSAEAYYTGENIYTIYRNLTIDLGENVLSVYQEWQNYIGIGANVTFQNGEIRVVRSSNIEKINIKSGDKITEYNNTSYNNRTFPLFRFSGNDKTLTLKNIKSYSGALIYNYNSSNAKVNIIGGEHHVTHHDESGAQGSWGGFVETRGSMTFTAENAVFFVDRSSWIITSTSYWDNYSSSAGTHAPKGSSFTFDGCTLISDANDSNGSFTLVKYANEHTKITFNNSLIYGSINPTLYSVGSTSDANRVTGEMWGAMPAENLVFGDETRIATSIDGVPTAFMGNTFANLNLNLIDEAYTYALVVKACNDKPYTEGYVFTNTTVKMTFQKVVADTVEITVTYHMPDGTEEIRHYQLGTVVTDFPTYAIPAPLDNGWVRINYDGGWSLEGYGDAISSLEVTGRIHLYPSATSARAYMSSAMYNLSLFGNVGVNLLIPDESNVPDGIILWSVYDTNGNLVVDYKSGIVGAGNSYNSYEIGKASVLSLDTPVIGKVYFTFNNIEFVQTITLNPYNYVTKVMTDSDSNPKSVTLLADMVRYATELYQFSTRDESGVPSVFTKEIAISGGTTTLEALSAEKASALSSADSFTGGEMGSFTANDYISAISFNLGGADPSYIVYFKEGTNVVDVEFIMNDAYLNTLDGYNRGKVVYGINDSLSTVFEGTEYLSSAQSTGIPIYNLDNFVEIRLTVMSELGAKQTVTCKGNYNLNSYYVGIAPSGDIVEADITRAKEVLRALRSFGESTAHYRYAEENAGETVSNKVSVYYEDFGAMADGTDDFGAIYEAHAYANEQKKLGRDVTVYAIKPDGRIAEGSTFFIDNTDSAGEYFTKSAIIQTDVDWTGAKFVINDYAIFEGNDSDNPSYTKVTSVTNKAFTTPLFMVTPDVSASSTQYQYRQINLSAGRKLFTTDTEIPEIAALGLPFETALVYIQNSAHHNYVRYGANAGSSVQREIILVDTKTGKIDPSTPIAHDFTAVSYLNIYNASEEEITLEGGSFETLYNRVNTYSYCSRGIDVRRSNVTIKGVVQDYTYSSYNEKVSGGAPMQQFFGTNRTHGLTIKDCIIEGPKIFYDTDNGDGTGTVMRGSYTIRADFASSITIENVKQTNLYRDGDSGAVNGIADHHAVMGSNYCKNFFFLDNYMSTFDAHTGLHNLIVKGCEVERINVIGTGTVIVEDTLIHTGVTHSAIVLREDYNSNFKGDVIFRDVKLETYNDNYVGLFWVAFYNYNTGLYYTDSSITWDSNGDGVADTTDSYHVQDTVKGGDDSKYYSSYLPQNVTVEGLTILRGGSIVTDENAELGGVYTRGDVVSTSDSKFMLALYNGRDIGFDIHEWNCDISKQGDSFKKGGFLGIGGTTYTVNHPIKPTEKVTNNTSYKVYEYVFNGKVYDNLKFLNNLVIE